MLILMANAKMRTTRTIHRRRRQPLGHHSSQRAEVSFIPAFPLPSVARLLGVLVLGVQIQRRTYPVHCTPRSTDVIVFHQRY